MNKIVLKFLECILYKCTKCSYTNRDYRWAKLVSLKLFLTEHFLRFMRTGLIINGRMDNV